MPPQQGETTVMSVAADVHYFFSATTQQPLHHRFQKTSYLYIYHDSAQRQIRLEIANAPGTPEQDATVGSLSMADITSHSSRPSLLSITVPTDAKPDSTQWKLPSYDLRNERKYLYPLHSLDIYFFVPQDTQDILQALRSLSSPTQQSTVTPQVEAPRTSIIVASKPEDASDGTSPVVQKLEKAAIGTPYQYALHGPGSPRAPPGPTAEAQSPAVYAPLTYNPSAPAKPEAIAHRERTPPPLTTEEGENAGGRSGLFSQGMSYGGQQSYFLPQQQLYSPSAPPQFQQSYASPPPQPTIPTSSFPVLTRTSSFPVSLPGATGMPSSPPPSSPFPGVSYIPASPEPTPYRSIHTGPPQSPPPPPQAPQQQKQQQQTYPSFEPPPTQAPHSPSYVFPPTPTTPFPHQLTFAASLPPASGTPYPVQLSSALPPLSGAPVPTPTPQNQYHQPQPQLHPSQSPYTIHTHVYIPTEAELAASTNPGGNRIDRGDQKPGKFEQRADRLEKGVNRFLKRLDGRF